MSMNDSFGGAKLPSVELEANVKYIRNIFTNDDTIQFRYLSSPYDSRLHFCLIFADGMINNKLMNDDILYPLLNYKFPEKIDDLMELILQNVILSNSTEKTADMEQIIQGIVYGDSILLADGSPDVLVLNTKGWTARSISEPETERVLRGPREGFNESLMINISMVRRKLRTPDLKMRYMTFGQRTRTKACICYLNSLVDKSVLKNLQQRLEKINIDGTLDTQYLTELIRDKPYGGVDTVGSTERPDVVAAKLLEGRIAVLLDGTPQVITVPYLFIESFQSDEDYYLSFFFSSIGRMLRIASFIISIDLPALYVALVTFHPEILPTPLLISIAQARQGVPFPSVLEMLVMLVVFEMLRESGARMPGIMGQALSIVGALVIGQAAVQAKIVSAPIIIIIAFTGIAGLMNIKIKGFTILIRFIMLAFVTILGLYGFLFGNIALLIHLFNIDSFGIPIMANNSARELQEFKDTYIRAPWWKMTKRPKGISSDSVRQKQGGAEK